MMDFSSEELVERINSTREGSVWDILDIKLVSAEKDKVVATMPIGPNQRQQVGYLHGGISVVLAESVASNSTAPRPSAYRMPALRAALNVSGSVFAFIAAA